MSVSPIIFFRKNWADYTYPAVIMGASGTNNPGNQGNSFASFVQKRSNEIGWMTTGSLDSDITTLTCNFVNLATMTDIILIGHNFASYTVKYWNGSSYVNFSPAISMSGDTASTTRFSFSTVNSTAIQITINGTQIANSDKKLNQLIATQIIGQFTGWPIIKNPTFNLNRRQNTMLSGKKNIGINVGGFEFTLSVANWNNNNDLGIIESIFSNGTGFLVWLSGGQEGQFATIRKGYRNKDMFFMKCVNDLGPEYYMGLYNSGMVINAQLAEVTV